MPTWQPCMMFPSKKVFANKIYFSGYATDPSEFDDDLDQDDEYSEDEPTTTVGYNEGWADNELVNISIKYGETVMCG